MPSTAQERSLPSPALPTRPWWPGLATLTALGLVLSSATPAHADATAAPAPPGSAAVSAEVTVPVEADTYVVREAPQTAYGSATKLAASNWSTPWHSEIYLRFPTPTPPPGQRIAAARLELTFQKLTQQPAALELRAVAGSGWSEAMTYATRPGTGAVLATAAVPAQGTPAVAFDVTSALPAGGSVSFAVTNPTAQSAGVFHSREYGVDAPRLVVSYAPTGGTRCGASFARENGETWAAALAREDSLFNGLDAVRFFHGGLPPAWPGPLDVGNRPLVVSFKGNARDYAAGTHDAQLRQWFASAPRDRDIYWVYYHEPEDNIRDGEFTAAEYRAAWRRLAGLADEAGNPRLHATMVLMQWTLVPASGRNWRDYYPGDGVLDVLAWDVYNYDSTAAKGEYLTPASLLDPVVAANTSVGLPFGVAELGSHIAAGDDGTRRAAWIRAMNDYLVTHGSLWNLWFDHAWSTGDYRLRDPAGLAAWREFCS
ncbi:DNRLRE domain-containing protein [Micromonospora sp. HM5-17]|uniref:CBM96 family carbohydrate-binding protein n=1 Tax=Micromonospora sp. HM5-17 TaxID=2487710 RepID=UPI000F49EE66|nr:DNRLRE domain-containing protein [Micromonospora sp. HM5-17]ROT29264.1 DNRLRE domain-containing protein [Micromonospora sp. HM5-17]